MVKNRVREGARGVGHVVAALTTHCSQFHRRWQAGATNIPAGYESLAGRWVGRWESYVNGHTGELRCVLIPETNGKFQAYFHATFMKWLRACYSVSLTGHEVEGAFRLQGEADLGRLAGGRYAYDGNIADGRFECHYTSESDKGIFHLHRAE